ncbi:ABC transporter ATP-binding protein [Wocania ichthyoenteri]|uniref:ABC transporter ATP-binding protein n=1 Tax=Wocania ichthyoenteri TaxID=1230531 RepID=UPI00053EB153|nr:ABC transporter ATP-binding protein [Wocania ichthyoenteri]
MSVILKVNNISKQYKLGLVGANTIGQDLNRWWSKVRGKEDPFLKIGEVNDRSTKGTSDYVWALKGINFEVKKGEVLGIIGKNGAGKSTLLKILSRVTSPTTGEIKTKGRIASLLEVGTGFHPEMTGRENIYLNGAILGMTKAEIKSKINEIIEFSGCERYIDTPVKRYSSGMTVRLAFAVAAHLEPDILVIDEVLAVGDAEFQKKAIGKMQDISRGEGRTVLFVSHNMAAVKNLCSRLIVLENGNISYQGKVDEGISKYIFDSLKNTSQNIEDRKDRIGNGNALLKKVTILNNSILTGEKFSVEIEFKNLGNFKVNELGLSVWKVDETKIISISTKLKNDIQFIDRTRAICEISKLPLVKGKYILNAFISTENGLADYIERILIFDVEENDYFNTGKQVDPNWGVIVVDHKWI